MRKTLLFTITWIWALFLFAQSEAEMEAFDQQNEVASLLVEGNYDAAIRQLEVLADRYKSLEAWENYFAILNQITQLYLETDRLVDAKTIAKKALWESMQRLDGSNDEAAKAAHKLAEVYATEKRYPKAMECHNMALEIRFKLFGELHPSIANSYDRIAAMKLNAKDYSSAWDYYDLALHKREQIFGADHPEVAQSYFNMGSLRYHQQQWEDALEYHEKALKIRKQELPEQDVKIAESLVQVNRIRQLMGKTVHLEELAKAAELYEISQEKSSLAAAQAYYELSRVLLHQGQLKNAAQYAALAVDISEKRHEQVVAYQTTLADVYFYLGQYADNRQILAPILDQISGTEKVTAYRQLVQGLLLEEQWEKAGHYASEYLTWIRIQPQSTASLETDARLLAAKAYMAQGLNAEAWKQLPLEHGKYSLPERLEMAIKLTEAAFQLQEKKYDAAIELYQEILDRIDSDEWDLNYEANVQLAYIYRYKAEQDINSIQNFSKAIDYYKKADYWLNQCPLALLGTSHDAAIWKNINDLYADAIGSSYALFQQTQNKEYIDQALFFSSRSKQWEKVIWACQMPAEWWSNPASELIAAWQGQRNAYAFELDRAYIKALMGERETIVDLDQLQNALQLSSDKLAKHTPDYYMLLRVDDWSDQVPYSSYVQENQYLYVYFWGNKFLYIFQVSNEVNQVWRIALDAPFMEALDEYAEFTRGKTTDKPALEASQIDYTEFAGAAHFLFQKLLPEFPQSAEEKKPIDLILIPDGALYYLPFECLLTSPAKRSNFAILPYLIYSANLYISPYLSTISHQEARDIWPFVAHPAYINQLCWGEADKVLLSLAEDGHSGAYPVCQTAMAGILPLQTYQAGLPDKTQDLWLAGFFHKMDKGEDSALALREAKIEFLERQVNTPGKAHPHFWATFISPGLPKPAFSKQLNFLIQWPYALSAAILILIVVLLRYRRTRKKIAAY
ncbi:MAG TPA: tetratricopeptide repeat protein [Saprospiraceae bacterium]|nr:tetratricopeptide repeat protein [Saprospiraceae bacterium]HMQ82380.1 tetratricopeptide repeat protein [Saprospiraceae bacterium]